MSSLALVAALAALWPAQAELNLDVAHELPAGITDTEVSQAIERMQRYLYRRMDRASGSWEDNLVPSSHRYGGVTALVTTALLVSGQTPQHPDLGRAIKFLKGASLSGTYEVAVRAHVWALLPDRYKSHLERDAVWLLNAHDGQGRYHYLPKPESFDHSVTQYAMLGLWEAAKRRARIPGKIWRQGVEHFISAQRDDGGWGYQPHSESKTSMTAAGLTVLLIGQQQLHRNSRRPPGHLSNAIDRGLGWLDQHFQEMPNITASGIDAGHHYYSLYSIERVALACGVKYLGRRDWFAVGARYIIDHTDNDTTSDDLGSIDNDLVSTAFGLMFLARGRVHCWVTKLAVPGIAWNNRPNDINQLTSYLSDLREVPLNWQMVSIDLPAETMLNAPVAYLASDDAVDLTDQQQANLKRYLDMGGLLMASADTSSTRFVNSVQQLAGRMYPHWPIKPLEPQHPMFHALHRIDTKANFRLQGVSNGARDLILLTTHDWGVQLQNDRPPGVKRTWQLAANLYALATDLGTGRPRLAMPFDMHRASRKAVGKVRIATALYGQPVVEPHAWPAMANHLFNQTGLEAELVEVPLEDLGSSDAALVHLGGADGVELSGPQLQALLDYARRGGTVLVETVGGRGQFATSVEKQLSDHLQAGAAPLSRKSPIITGETLLKRGGYDNRRVRYRRVAVTTMALGVRCRFAAHLIDRRPAIIYSHEDLSLGMMGVRHWHILGYTPESARQLVTNVVLSCVKKDEMNEK